MSTDPRFQQAVALIRAGKRAEAQPILMELIKGDSKNADLWYYAAATVGQDRRVEFLQRALAVDPGHQKARDMLTKLSAPASVAHTPFIDPQAVSPAVSKPKPRVDWLATLAAALAVLIIAALVVLVVIQGRQIAELRDSATQAAIALAATNAVQSPAPATAVADFTPSMASIPTAANPFTASSASENCNYSADQKAAITEFFDTTETAVSTSRASLSGVVLELQKQYRAFERMEFDDCIKDINDHMTRGMRYTVDAMQEFLGDADSVMVSVNIDLAIEEFEAIENSLGKNGFIPPDVRMVSPKLMIFHQNS